MLSILFNNLPDFCQGYFHIDDCKEWDQNEYCLQCSTFKTNGLLTNKKVCLKSTVHGLLTIYDNINNQIIFYKAYKNIFMGSTEENIHVEDLIVADKELEAYLKENLIVTLYISYQPCHHSGGRRNMAADHIHTKSCTELIRKWWIEKLIPKNITFNIKCLGIYRAHWTDENSFGSDFDRDVFLNRTERAREGLRLLMKSHENKIINVDAMNPNDWKIILLFCSLPIKISIKENMWKVRYEYDDKIRDFLNSYKN